MFWCQILPCVEGQFASQWNGGSLESWDTSISLSKCQFLWQSRQVSGFGWYSWWSTETFAAIWSRLFCFPLCGWSSGLLFPCASCLCRYDTCIAGGKCKLFSCWRRTMLSHNYVKLLNKKFCSCSFIIYMLLSINWCLIVSLKVSVHEVTVSDPMDSANLFEPSFAAINGSFSELRKKVELLTSDITASDTVKFLMRSTPGR